MVDDECYYLSGTQLLFVEFTVYKAGGKRFAPNGKPYQYLYHNVPQTLAEDWLDDKCNGETYNSSIRDSYAHTRVN